MSTFKRDAFTVLDYGSLAYYAYLQAVFGPAVPFLRAELGLSYTISGLHLSAFALGMVLAGLFTDRLAERFGRWSVYWGGGLGMAAGVVLFIAAQSPVLTILSSFVASICGSCLLVLIQATLSDHHHEHRALALTESNIGASVTSALAPAAVGIFENIGWGWRMAFVAGALTWLGLFVAGRKIPLPQSSTLERSHTAQVSSSGRLPLQFWTLWVVVFLVVSTEWCLIFWGSDFLEKVVGLAKADAALTMTVFFAAMAIGRFAGSRLTRRFDPVQLLPAATVLALIGFLVFWRGPGQVIPVAGLFAAGLGVANLFPLTLSAASAVAPHLSARASGRISFGAGVAILIVPQVLATTADQVGISTAYGITLVMLVAVMIALYAQRRLSSITVPG